MRTLFATILLLPPTSSQPAFLAPSLPLAPSWFSPCLWELGPPSALAVWPGNASAPPSILYQVFTRAPTSDFGSARGFKLDIQLTLVSLNTSTGARAWVAELSSQPSTTENYHAMGELTTANSPAVTSRGTVLAFSRVGLTAFSVATGSVLWSARLDAAPLSGAPAPSPDGARVFAALANHKVVGLDTSTGIQLWPALSIPLLDCPRLHLLAASNSRLFVCGAEGVVAFAASGGPSVWNSRVRCGGASPPFVGTSCTPSTLTVVRRALVADEAVLAVQGDAGVTLLSAATGGELRPFVDKQFRASSGPEAAAFELIGSLGGAMLVAHYDIQQPFGAIMAPSVLRVSGGNTTAPGATGVMPRASREYGAPIVSADGVVFYGASPYTANTYWTFPYTANWAPPTLLCAISPRLPQNQSAACAPNTYSDGAITPSSPTLADRTLLLTSPPSPYSITGWACYGGPFCRNTFRGVGVLALRGDAAAHAAPAAPPVCPFPEVTDYSTLIPFIVAICLLSLSCITGTIYFSLIRQEAKGRRLCFCLCDALSCAFGEDPDVRRATQAELARLRALPIAGVGGEWSMLGAFTSNPLLRAPANPLRSEKEERLRRASLMADLRADASPQAAEEERKKSHVVIDSASGGGARAAALVGAGGVGEARRLVLPRYCVRAGRFCPAACACCDPFREGEESPFYAYGAGPTSFFKQVKLLAWISLVMLLLATPALALNGASAQPLSLASASFAGLSNATLVNGDTSGGTVPAAEPLVLFGGRVVLPRAHFGAAYALSDLLVSLAFFVGWVWSAAFTEAEHREVDEDTLTASQYTVMLPDLPGDVSEGELRAFFHRVLPPEVGVPHEPRVGGKVAAVHLVRRSTRAVMLALQARAAAFAALDRALARLTSLKEALAVADSRGGARGASIHRAPCCGLPAAIHRTAARIQALEEDRVRLTARVRHGKVDNRVVAAFVTLERPEAKDWLLSRYPDTFSRGAVCQRRKFMLRPGWCCCACCEPRTRMLPAPPPSSVVWENLRVTDDERRLRELVTYLQTFCIVLVAAGMLWGVNYGRTTVSPGRVLALGLALASSLVVLALNALTVELMRALSKFVAHRSLEDEEAGLFTRLFVAQFTNTALIPIILGARFPGTETLPAFLHMGEQTDLGAAWYESVGTQFVTTMFLLIATSTARDVTEAVRAWLHRRRLADAADAAAAAGGGGGSGEWALPPAARVLAAACFCCARVPSKPTQRDLNDAFRGPLANWSVLYATLAKVLGVCFVFSSTIPILHLVALAFFTVFYFVSKGMFLWYYRAPPAFGVALQRKFVATMPWMIILRALWGAWALSYGGASDGSAQFLPWRSGGGADPASFDDVLKRVREKSPPVFASPARFLHLVAIPQLALGAFTLGLLLLTTVLRGFAECVLSVFHVLTCGLCRAKKQAASWQETFSVLDFTRAVESTAAGTRLLVGSPSYNILEDPNIQAAFSLPEGFAATHKELADAALYSPAEDKRCAPARAAGEAGAPSPMAQRGGGEAAPHLGASGGGRHSPQPARVASPLLAPRFLPPAPPPFALELEGAAVEGQHFAGDRSVAAEGDAAGEEGAFVVPVAVFISGGAACDGSVDAEAAAESGGVAVPVDGDARSEDGSIAVAAADAEGTAPALASAADMEEVGLAPVPALEPVTGASAAEVHVDGRDLAPSPAESETRAQGVAVASAPLEAVEGGAGADGEAGLAPAPAPEPVTVEAAVLEAAEGGGWSSAAGEDVPAWGHY